MKRHWPQQIKKEVLEIPPQVTIVDSFHPKGSVLIDSHAKAKAIIEKRENDARVQRLLSRNLQKKQQLELPPTSTIVETVKAKRLKRSSAIEQAEVKPLLAIEDSESQAEVKYEEIDIKPEKDYSHVDKGSNDYSIPKNGVLGVGKGLAKGLPKHEFKSVWQFDVPELDAKEPSPWTQDPAEPPNEIKATILSVVGSVSLGQALDLEYIAVRGTNLHYNPESFTPLVMRLKKLDATALVFRSGKMVVTGTKSEVENKIATRRFARMIQKMGYRVSVKGIQIQNISATCNLGFRVRVNLLAADPNYKVQQGPDIFNGVTIVLEHPKAKVVVFRTGSVLITGATSEADIRSAIKIIYPISKIYAN